MIKNVLKPLLYFTLTLSLFACEKVIDIDLNEIDQRNVVEAVVMEGLGNNYVLLSKTSNYFSAAEYLLLSGATVSIKDDQGGEYLCTSLDSGLYSAPSLIGTAGVTYTLMVLINGEEITASSKMPSRVEIDSVTTEFRKGFGPDGFYTVNCYYNDPLTAGNYYKYDLFINGEKLESIQLNDDQYSNGVSTYAQLFSFKQELKISDSLKVVMQSIDQKNHRYLSAIAEGGFGGGAETVPGNPESNLNGNALGYFGAYSSSFGLAVVK